MRRASAIPALTIAANGLTFAAIGPEPNPDSGQSAMHRTAGWAGNLAPRRLEQTNFQLKHIGFISGYSASAAGARADKRWTGKSPGETRRQ